MADGLIIQNLKIEGLGTPENHLESDGFQIWSVYAKNEKIPIVQKNMNVFYKNFKLKYNLWPKFNIPI